MVYGYKIVDGLIQPVGASDKLERLEKALDLAGIDHADMLTQETPLVMADGKYYLSENDPDYITAKAQENNEAEIAKVDAQYEADKAELAGYYVDFLMTNDVEGQQAIKDELEVLNAQYDLDIEALSE